MILFVALGNVALFSQVFIFQDGFVSGVYSVDDFDSITIKRPIVSYFLKEAYEPLHRDWLSLSSWILGVARNNDR